MKILLRKLTRFFNIRSFVAVLAVITGLGLTLFFGLRTFQSFRRMPEFPPHPPHPAETDVETIRPWMNLQFIAKVYNVPPDYLRRYLEVPTDTAKNQRALAEINRELGWGETANGEPRIIERVQFAITEFYAHPGGPDLREIQPAMSIQFISAVTGIPSDYLFENLGIPKTDNAYKSLELLSQEQHYVGGWESLARDLRQIIEAHEGN